MKTAHCPRLLSPTLPSANATQRIGPLLLFLPLLLALISNGLRGAENTSGESAEIWQVGMAKTKITPNQSIMMGGFASRRDPFRGVVHDLWVKALTIADHRGNQAVLITCDFIGFRAVNSDPICAEIMRRTGLTRDQILINSSHTHTGPSQAESPDKDSYLEPSQIRELFHYTEWLKTKVVDTAIASMQNLSPAYLSHDVGVAPFVMNRREPTKRGIVLGHNPRGPADRSVPILKVADLNGVVKGIVFGAACHNTTIPPQDNQVCGDYAGFAQLKLEETYPQAQAMFMQGCGGDAGPYPTGSLELSAQHGDTLAQEVTRILAQDSFAPLHGPLRTEFRQIDLPLQAPMTSDQITDMEQGPAQWRRWVGAKMRERHDNGDPWPMHYAAPFAVWQFGEDLTLVGLSGEVVVDYVTQLSSALGPLDLWISAYCNDVFGYLPSARVLAEGGYETRGIYGGDRFSPQVETVVIEAVRDLATKAGRPQLIAVGP